jgi:hypothetical protein
MALESVFLNLCRGNRLSNLMGLKLDALDSAPKFGSTYTYVEIPVGGVFKDGEPVEGKIVRNQYVRINPACTVDCRGRDAILVEPNPAIAEFGMIQGSYYIHPESGELRPFFWFQARKDVAIEDLGYAVRLYMQP